MFIGLDLLWIFQMIPILRGLFNIERLSNLWTEGSRQNLARVFHEDFSIRSQRQALSDMDPTSDHKHDFCQFRPSFWISALQDCVVEYGWGDRSEELPSSIA